MIRNGIFFNRMNRIDSILAGRGGGFVTLGSKVVISSKDETKLPRAAFRGGSV